MIKIKTAVSLAEFTSFKVGGSADLFAAPATIDELAQAVQWAHDNGHLVTVLGGGTNVLVSDNGVRGLLIHTIGLNEIQVVQNSDSQELLVEAQCGVTKSALSKIFLERKLAPAEFLVGLPGDVAGGVVMNAGVGFDSLPKEFCEIVDKVEVLSIANDKVKARLVHATDMDWSYRFSSGWGPGVISRVWFKWSGAEDAEVMNRVRASNKFRLTRQPLKENTCGSTFTNPPGTSAGYLIDQAGLKGVSIGGAMVSNMHANFLEAKEGATATDIDQLIQLIQKKVKYSSGIDLHPEVVRLGDW